MRSLAILFLASVLAACSATPDTRDASQAASPTAVGPAPPSTASIDEIVQFLLKAAATDFHTHGPSKRIQFREVRLGHVATPSGDKQYRLCGQFLPSQEDGKAEWVLFATIKTSGYEQWIGGQATSFCEGASVVWDEVPDLSSSLQSRFDSLE